MNRNCIHNEYCPRGARMAQPCACEDEERWYSGPAVVVYAVLGLGWALFFLLCALLIGTR